MVCVLLFLNLTEWRLFILIWTLIQCSAHCYQAFGLKRHIPCQPSASCLKIYRLLHFKLFFVKPLSQPLTRQATFLCREALKEELKSDSEEHNIKPALDLLESWGFRILWAAYLQSVHVLQSPTRRAACQNFEPSQLQVPSWEPHKWSKVEKKQTTAKKIKQLLVS